MADRIEGREGEIDGVVVSEIESWRAIFSGEQIALPA